MEDLDAVNYTEDNDVPQLSDIDFDFLNDDNHNIEKEPGGINNKELLDMKYEDVFRYISSLDVLLMKKSHCRY